MKINDLKIGDRIKYYWMGGQVVEGIVKCILSNPTWKEKYFNVTPIGTREINSFWESGIISKLEFIPSQYKEIPIEKEKQNDKKIKLEDLTEKQFNSLKESGFLFEFYPESDGVYKNNKDNPQKTYKFDIEYFNFVEWNQDPIRPGYCPSAYFKIGGAKINYYENQSLDFQKLYGKKLTIEIKEKID